MWQLVNNLKMRFATSNSMNFSHFFRCNASARLSCPLFVGWPQKRPSVCHSLNWTCWTTKEKIGQSLLLSGIQSSPCLLYKDGNTSLKGETNLTLFENKLASKRCFTFGPAGFKTDCSGLGQQNFKLLAFSPSRWQDLRCFSSKANRPSKGKNKQAISEETDSDSDTMDDNYDLDDPERDWDPEIDGKMGLNDEIEEEGGVVKDWKDVQQHVPSLRIDAVLSAGLGISRRKIEDAFLSARLRINGQKVMKKSRQVNEGDILDVILERSLQAKTGEDESVMRVHVLEIGSEKTVKGRVLVLLRRWKNLNIKENK